MGKTNLGYMYLTGNYAVKDYTKALELFKKAADQGNINAMNQIGLMYISRGYGMQDHNEAKKCYLKSANMGDELAEYQLGWLYQYRKEYEKALTWYRLSAKQGNKQSIKAVEYLENNGSGI